MYTTKTLLGVLNLNLAFETFFLNMFFRQEATFDTEEIDLDKVLPDLSVAPYISPVVAGVVQKDKSMQTSSFKPAYHKPMHAIEPDKHVYKRRPGEAFNTPQSAAQREQAAVSDLLMLQRDQVMRAWEKQASEAILNGEVIIEGSNYPKTQVSYQRDNENTITYTGTDKWDDSGAKPLDAMEAEVTDMDYPADVIVMSKEAWALVKARHTDAEIAARFDKNNGAGISIELGIQASKIAYKGMMGEVHVYVHNGFYHDEAGNKQYIMSGAKVLYVNSVAVGGVRCFGSIRDPKADYKGFPLFPKTFEKDDPAGKFLQTQSAPLMVVGNANATRLVTVK
ncbi:major capsid protein [Marinicellulosiphila megalodicopiae]|uniref:major capsid protein n=1 Tax=Marinicellulosiphila megalodicopiae TaxID=2724896 RepID=UPI003BAEBCB3